MPSRLDQYLLTQIKQVLIVIAPITWTIGKYCVKKPGIPAKTTDNKIFMTASHESEA